MSPSRPWPAAGHPLLGKAKVLINIPQFGAMGQAAIPGLDSRAAGLLRAQGGRKRARRRVVHQAPAPGCRGPGSKRRLPALGRSGRNVEPQSHPECEREPAEVIRGAGAAEGEF